MRESSYQRQSLTVTSWWLLYSRIPQGEVQVRHTALFHLGNILDCGKSRHMPFDAVTRAILAQVGGLEETKIKPPPQPNHRHHGDR